MLAIWLLSLITGVTAWLYDLPSSTPVIVGFSLSIQVTFAVTESSTPNSSTYSNVNSPFLLNTYWLLPPLFLIVTLSLFVNLIVAVTLLFVKSFVL